MTPDVLTLRPIARIRCGLPAKFGIPRQSGLVPGLRGMVVFEPEFRVAEALRGLEGFSHVWLLWGFSANARPPGEWTPTVRPPRLGGNERMGVFATRSPYRPNPVGLSCVRLEGIGTEPGLGSVLRVRGADLMDGTPVYDIKPYVPYADSVPDAHAGFAAEAPGPQLEVDIPEELEKRIPDDERAPLRALLAADPRPAYLRNPERIHGLSYAGMDIRFRVEEKTLAVVDIRPLGA